MSRLPFVLLTSLFLVPDVTAQNWSQWRGSLRDGSVADAKLPTKWPKELTKVWQVPVGEGHSSPIVVGNRIFVHTRRGELETVACFERESGKEVWKVTNEAPYQMHSAATGHGKGPKSTPTFKDGKLYTLGISGILTCIDTETGKLIWRKEFSKDFKLTSPLYGTAMSPLITDACVVHVGGHDAGKLAGFDLKTGEIRWTASTDGPGYASPILGKLAGKEQIITQTQNHVVGIDREGKLLWKKAYTTGYDQNTITATIHQDLLIYSGYGNPLEAVRIQEKDGKLVPEKVWENKELSLYMSSPVLVGDRLFGLSDKRSGQLFCADAKTGKTIWRSEGRDGDYAGFLACGDVVLVVTHDAKLIVMNAKSDKEQRLAAYSLADGPTWAYPALSGNQLFIKGKNSLTRYVIE